LVPEDLSLQVKQPGCEADHSHLLLRLKNAWRYTSASQYAFMSWYSVKAQ